MKEDNSSFSEKTITFLKRLKSNNNREWFERHKSEYENHLLHPFQSLVLNLNDFMSSIDTAFETAPSVGKTISRIYRDVRFSKDKSPYRANMWLVYKRSGKEWQGAPGYFFEVAHDSYRYGMGYYTAGKKTMDNFRNFIERAPEEFRDIISFYYQPQNEIIIGGEKYKKKLIDGLEEDLMEWYQRKNLYVIAERSIDDLLFSDDLAIELASNFGNLAPLYNLMWECIG